MRWAQSILAATTLVASAFAQTQGSWTDTQTGITFWSYWDDAYKQQYSFVRPPAGSTTYTNEFIGQFSIPIAGKWAGISLGVGMNNNVLIIAWPNAGSIVWSVRQALNYLLPTPYAGPQITTLHTSINATHWKWTYRCTNCTTWTINGFSGAMGDAYAMGWAYATTAVTTPSSPTSGFLQHDDARIFGFDFDSVRSNNYGNYLGTPASTTSRPASTTVRTTTSTRVTTSTRIPTVSATPYDYVVVGAGNCGLVVADRLSEAGKKVLVIERGGPSTKDTGATIEVPPWLEGTGLTRFDVPGLFETMFGSNNPWWWCSDVSVFAGCLTGGGAAINGALYWFPPDIDFATANNWPSGWQNVGHYINKMKTRLPSTITPSADGQLYLTQVYDLVSRLLTPRGFTYGVVNDNPNWKDHIFGRPAYAIKDGIRNGPMGTYYKTAVARTNLKFWNWVYVKSLVRNGAQITGVRTNYTAYGGNGVVPLTTRGRVILSAGVFGSSRILFASGIGPSDMIANVAGHSEYSAYLPPSNQYINLPVGQNVQDNPSINLVFTHPSIDAYDNWQPIWNSPRPADAAQFRNSRSGVFASGTSPRINFWEVLTGSDGKSRYMQGTARPGGWPTTNYAFNASQVFTITCYLSTGITSKGRIGIDNTMYSKVITNPWFTDPVDRTTIITGVNRVLSTMSQVSGLTLITPDRDTTVTDYVNNYAPSSLNSNHWVGSTRLGTSSSTSVTDTNTKVWNTNNLFVVDAGTVPVQPMSNPHAMFMVFAEMAVDKILALSGGP